MKLDTQMTIAANLRTLRITCNMSQTDMSRVIDTSRGLYSNFELGRTSQDAEVLYDIAAYHGLDMAMFFESDPRKFFSYLADHYNRDYELKELGRIYKQLSPFSKGMLMERANWLLEKEKAESAEASIIAPPDRGGFK